MKRIPFQGPLWWRLTFLLGSICVLSADKQFIKNFFVQKKLFQPSKTNGYRDPIILMMRRINLSIYRQRQA